MQLLRLSAILLLTELNEKISVRSRKDVANFLCSACSAEKKTEMATLATSTHRTTTDTL